MEGKNKTWYATYLSLNFYIPEAFKNRRISSAENGCGTEAAEQIRTVR